MKATNLLIALGFLVVAGLSFYAGQIAVQDSPSPEGKTEEEKAVAAEQELAAETEGELTFKTCERAQTLGRNTKSGRYWYGVAQQFYPEATIYDIGVHCELTDGTHLVSMVVQTTKTNGSFSYEQKIILADSESKKIQETTGLVEKTLGDYVSANLESLSDGKLRFTFNSTDAGRNCRAIYELTLTDFEYREIDSKCS